MAIALKRSALFLTIGLSLAAGSATAAPAFMYVTVPESCDGAGICGVPGLLVYDQSTLAFTVGLPLPGGTTPRSVAIAPDGRHVYVSNAPTGSGAASITVVDALRHQIIGTFPAPGAGRLAVRADGSRLYIFAPRATAVSDDRVFVWDTDTHALVDTIASSDPIGAIAANPVLDRFYIVRNNLAAGPGNPRAVLSAYDGASDGVLSASTYGFDGALDVDVSADGRRIYALLQRVTSDPAAGGRIVVFDANTHALIGSINGGFPRGVAAGAAGHFLFSADDDGVHPTLTGVRLFDSLSALPPGVFQGNASPVISLALPISAAVEPTRDESRLFVSSGVDLSGNHARNTLLVVDSLTGATLRTESLPGSADTLHFASTPTSAPACSYVLSATDSTWTVSGGTGIVSVTTNCAWNVRIDQPWVHLVDTPGGAGAATVPFIVDPNVLPTNRSATLSIGGQIVTIVQAGHNSAPPFGVIDTPADNTTGVSGILPVTGWALDDIGLQRVSIFRDSVPGEAGAQVFIGDATRVSGARPDVRAAFPSLPNGNDAGWGLAVLTNMLPDGGNGTFRLLAYAQDIEGHISLLGTKTFTAVNRSIDRPFGTIDTPDQGQTVSGVIINFGWALTPGSATIPSDGSTIDVLIDGVAVGHPVYNNFRADIFGLFPDYTNRDGAVGYFVLDTRVLADGLHSMAWIVTDNQGRTAGIGSRFFTVRNVDECGAGCPALPPAATHTIRFSGVGPENSPMVGTYLESGFVVAPSPGWQARQVYGNPAPFIYFASTRGNTTNEIAITSPIGPFRFTSVDLYSSISTIPYVISGFRNGVEMFTIANSLPNTFGNFATVSNAFPAVTIDRLVIRLLNQYPLNPMGIDNVVVSR